MAEESVVIPISTAQIGIVGSGFMARGIARALDAGRFRVGPVLTRRPIDSVDAFPIDVQFTNHVDQLIENCDLVVISCGDPIHSTDVIDKVMEAGLPVVTLDPELHVTTGSWFIDKGIISEAEGDQPGCLAALRREALEMGFEPLVYGNVKGFLNHHPTLEDMEYFSAKNGTSLAQTTSFTDGTKLQIEQAFVANAFGADIYRPGLIGPHADGSIENGAEMLATVAERHGHPISDYVIMGGSPAVFIAAKHEKFHRPYLSHMKMGDGPFYNLIKNYHLCHLEVIKTVRAILSKGSSGILMNNGLNPRISVATIAKRRLQKDDLIEQGIGSFDVRGAAIEIADDPNHLPIGLLANARVKHTIEPGDRLSFDDVELPESKALDIWGKLSERAVTAGAWIAASGSEVVSFAASAT
jgi:predicted homoserine dehydrogenase-like protein